MKDYWSMSENELAELAKQFDIETTAYDDAYQAYFRRDYIIAFLNNRDTALRTDTRSNIAMGVSVLAFLFSVLTFIFK